MKYRQVGRHDGLSVYLLVFDPGDETMEGLLRFAREAGVTAASFSGIGGCERLTVGYYSREEGRYRPIEIAEQVEVLSLLGNVAMMDGKPFVHAHIAVNSAHGAARGGHLLSAVVLPTMEVVVNETPAYFRRTLRAGIPLPTIDLDGSTTSG